MTIVIDANLAMAVVVSMDHTIPATERLRQWKLSQTTLIAPMLFEYEIVTALRKSVILNVLNEAEAQDALGSILSLGIEMVAPDRDLERQALIMAARIGQSQAYDAHYLALAEHENAAFWTADRRLLPRRKAPGWTWVHWIAEDAAP